MQYLYIIKCNDFHKIGIANDVEARLAQLSTGNPYSLEVIAIYGFQNAETVERSLHQKYANVRNRGEWFKLHEMDLIDIDLVCKLLGGQIITETYTPTNENIEEAEEAQTVFGGDKFDYAMMFKDGWRMAEQGRDSKYWNWRRGSNNQETIYGGMISSLPYSIENMRRVYRDGLEPI